MWDDQTIMMLLEGTRDTLYMTLVSTFFGYVLGLPLGILLAVTDKEGIRPNAPLYKILDVIVNILRSIPFLILLILVIPLTKKPSKAVIIFAIIGVLVAVAAAAYGIYRFFTPDYLDDFDDEYDDEFDDDFFEDEDDDDAEDEKEAPKTKEEK